ncbi:MAG: FtsX-like permease family protein [Candidatus Aminicenantes bacterium]|nr:FtsX-like permease family protein [Candidatus Aminicenantes bacterium]
MIKNYFKIALRTIKNHKGYSFINITGLAIGIACCILILLWVNEELSYDRFHKNTDLLYRVNAINETTEQIYDQWQMPAPLSPALKEEIPEIQFSTRYLKLGGEWLVRYGDKNFMESAFSLVDPDLFQMFTFPAVEGNLNNALSDPHSVVITQKIADKYFPDEDPIGKILHVEGTLDFAVQAVIKNMPHNSHLQCDFFIPFILLGEMATEYDVMEDWNIQNNETFVLLQKKSTAQDVDQKISHFLDKHLEKQRLVLYLQPLRKIHLFSTNIRGPITPGKGDITYVYVFSLIAVFILITACINFMNLTTARSTTRAKEVGLRKVIGAYRSKIIQQFFGESLLMSFISLGLAIVLVELLLPAFTSISGVQLSLSYGRNIKMLLAIVAIAFFTGILAGSYPALYLSSFQPVKVMKGIFFLGSQGASFRKILVIVQFSISILLIICTIIISDQIVFMKTKKLGFEKEHIVIMRIRGGFRQNYESAKNEMLMSPEILAVTQTSVAPTKGASYSGPATDWVGKKPEENIPWYLIAVGYDYLETLNIEMAQGRFFSKEFAIDESSVVVNETAANIVGGKSPLGRQFTFWGKKFRIMGVVKDYHFSPMQFTLKPLILAYMPEDFRYFVIKIDPERISDAIASMEYAWKNFSPDYPFEYRFLDEEYDAMYRTEQRVGTIFKSFALLAIIISCLGLFGLASFLAERRTKEIGIRKALGASISEIVLLLSKEFTKWVVVANLIAWPIAYFAMHQWLQGFAHRISIGMGPFVMAALLAVFIALLTVIYQAAKAALTDPAKALRYE